MKNRDNVKNKLQNTDDETLKRMLETIAAASGISEERKNAMLSELPKIRSLLNEAGDEKLSALIASMGIGSLSDALKRLNGDNK